MRVTLSPWLRSGSGNLREQKGRFRFALTGNTHAGVRLFFTFFFAIILFISPGFAQDSGILFHEDFRNLANWEPLLFPKIKKHTQYSVTNKDGKTCLRAESNASASALIYKEEFNVYEYPRMRWQWKIEHVYQKGNVTKKSGDDYPIRVYVVFRYDPAKATFWQKIKFGLAKKIYGEYPPHSSLNYIWANRRDEQGIVTNPYADESKMVILQAGPENAGKWLEENVHIVADYRKAFGTDPPAMARIAVMNDSDNTGESSVSYICDLEVYK